MCIHPFDTIKLQIFLLFIFILDTFPFPFLEIHFTNETCLNASFVQSINLEQLNLPDLNMNAQSKYIYSVSFQSYILFEHHKIFFYGCVFSQMFCGFCRPDSVAWLICKRDLLFFRKLFLLFFANIFNVYVCMYVCMYILIYIYIIYFIF